MGKETAVSKVRIHNRQDEWRNQLTGAIVAFIGSDGKIIESAELPNMQDKDYYDVIFRNSFIESNVHAWKTYSPTGEPLLSDEGKEQLRQYFFLNNATLDASIALVFGNKTTIGQVCSFAKGLKSNTVTNIPGFCCLDAPYQSKLEYWGEKVSSWDARRLVL